LTTGKNGVATLCLPGVPDFGTQSVHSEPVVSLSRPPLVVRKPVLSDHTAACIFDRADTGMTGRQRIRFLGSVFTIPAQTAGTASDYSFRQPPITPRLASRRLPVGLQTVAAIRQRKSAPICLPHRTLDCNSSFFRNVPILMSTSTRPTSLWQNRLHSPSVGGRKPDSSLARRRQAAFLRDSS
jgi:hypothetical protein